MASRHIGDDYRSVVGFKPQLVDITEVVFCCDGLSHVQTDCCIISILNKVNDVGESDNMETLSIEQRKRIKQSKVTGSKRKGGNVNVSPLTQNDDLDT